MQISVKETFGRSPEAPERGHEQNNAQHEMK